MANYTELEEAIVHLENAGYTGASKVLKEYSAGKPRCKKHKQLMYDMSGIFIDTTPLWMCPACVADDDFCHQPVWSTD